MPADLDAPLLRTFLACVRAGSLGRAAVMLARTQPAVSQQLRRLEDIVGEPVLRRSPSGVTLTPAGERLLPYAERILALSAEAIGGAGRGRPLAGRCGVGLLEDFATPSLSGALADFAARHPAAHLEIVTLSGVALREAFDQGRVQLVLGDTSDLSCRPVRTARLPLVWVAAPPLHRPADPVPLALFSHPCRWREPVQQALDRAGRRWRVAFESTGLAGVLAGIQAGLGVGALLPSSVRSGLVVLGAASGLPPLPDVEVGLARLPGSEGNLLVDALAALLADVVWAGG